MKCSICNSDNTTPLHSLYDDRYGYHGLFNSVKCLSCHHVIIEETFSSDSLESLYSVNYPRSLFDVENYRPLEKVVGFKAWLNGAYNSPYQWVPEKVRILDIGCGFGQSLGYHRDRGCDVYGVEADKNILRVAEKHDFKVHVGIFNPHIYEDEYFDYITMEQVIEHFDDPVKILKGIRKILKPGGVVLISTPNSNGWGAKLFGQKWINWHAPYHLNLFSIKSLKVAVDKSGFTLDYCRTITNSDWLLYQWLHLITFPKMGKTSSFWSIGQPKSLLQKILSKLVDILHMTKLNHLVTRFFDSLGIGDNIFVILKKL